MESVEVNFVMMTMSSNGQETSSEIGPLKCVINFHIQLNFLELVECGLFKITESQGSAPLGMEEVGECTQMAKFILEQSSLDSVKESAISNIQRSKYVLVECILYQSTLDERSLEMKITDEVVYHVNRLSRAKVEEGFSEIVVTISELFKIASINKLCKSEFELEELVTKFSNQNSSCAICVQSSNVWMKED